MYHFVRLTRAGNLWLPLRELARCTDLSIIIFPPELERQRKSLSNVLFYQKTELPDLGFMTDVKYIDMCCEADHLIGKEMKAHQEDEWEASLKGFLVSVKVWQWPWRRANEQMRVDTLETVPYHGTKIQMSPCSRGLGEACRGVSIVPWRGSHRDRGEVSFTFFAEDTDLCVGPWRSLGPAQGLFFFFF